jgi:D-serine deaminase-like pyridoxal phosphate-dependent protein
MFEATSSIYHELQAGSYIFMDADYAKNEWIESGIPQFEHSLFVWTTVMSAPARDRVVVDAGLKASSTDSGMPRVADYPMSNIRKHRTSTAYCKSTAQRA